jgi:hypothetical protein
MLLKKSTFGFGLARRIVNGEPEEPDQALGLCSGDAITSTGALVSFYGWFMRSIEDKDGLNGGTEEAREAVEEGSDRWVRST